MKFKAILLCISCLFSTALFAQWKNVGNGDYNWGPFQVYTLSLYSENGTYKENMRPLMLTFKYAKPIEGKSFAVNLVKEINSLNFNKDSSAAWLKKMQEIFPDFSPNDVLSYIALENKGYFILNDTILNHEFDASFNQALLAIWLSPQSNFKQLQHQLIGKEKSAYPDGDFLPHPEVQQLDEEDANPQMPPTFERQQKTETES